MSGSYFPQGEFKRALSVTSKLKEQLQPFIGEVLRNNMEWIFFMCSELYQYLTLGEFEIIYKFNSLAAIKILLDTCEFPVILITEVYFLPHILKIASYQLNAHEKTRGLDYFSNYGYQKNDLTKKLGYNYVRLACEIISIFSVVKPYKLFKNQQITEQSDFLTALYNLKSQSWKEYDSLAFYSQNPLVLRSFFLEKLQTYFQDMKNYEKFIRNSLDIIIRKDLHPIGLDIRKILESYQAHSCSLAFQILKEMASQNEAVILVNVLKIMTDFVRWGNIRAFYLIEIQGIFDKYFDMIVSHNSDVADADRGTYIFYHIEGLDEDRVDLYTQLLRSLQVWTVCIAKNLIDPKNQSKVTILYKNLKNELKIQFPYISNLKKIRNQSSQNLQRHKYYNQKQLKFTKQNSISKVMMRRGSAELKQLMNNTTSKNMKSIFNQTRIHNKNKSDGRSRIKQIDQSICQMEERLNFNSTDKENIFLREKIQKSCTFTETFFREKNKKRRNRSTNESVIQESQNLTLSSGKPTNLCELTTPNACNFDSKYINRTDPNSRAGAFRWKAQLSKNDQDEDDVIDDDSWDTDYSSELEEETNIKNMRTIDNLHRRQQAISKPLVSFNETEYTDKKTGKFLSHASIKSTFKKDIDTIRSSNIQFFQESQSNKSSISNSSIFRSCETPQIIVNGPHPHSIQTNVRRDDLVQERQESSHLIDENCFKKTPTKLQFYQLEEKVVCLEAEKTELKSQLEKKQKEISKLRSTQKEGNIQIQESNFDWSKYLFSEEQISEGLSGKKKKVETPRQRSGNKLQIISCRHYQSQLNQLRQIQSKKLLKNKDLLMKNDKIEIGFIFQQRINYSDITLFITPQKDITKLKYYVKTCKGASLVEEGEPVALVGRNKQKKIKYRIVVQPPYSLPQFFLSFEMEGHGYHHNILIPISYNKFIEIEPCYPHIEGQEIVRQTSIGMLNKNLFRCASQILVYFSGFKLKSHKEEQQMIGSLTIQRRKVNLRLVIQGDDFVQIEYSIKENDAQILETVQFYVLTLFYVLTK